MDDLLAKLQAPFHPTDIEWRVQREVNGRNGLQAVVLAYVTNRAIMKRLDEVFGPTGWQNEYKEWRDEGVLCGISAKVEGEWVTKWDGSEATAVESTKGGFSGSMKRAAVQWGIGRYLYKLEGIKVPLKDSGENYHKHKDQNNKVKYLYWDTPQLPDWALPQESRPSKINQQQLVNIRNTIAEISELSKTPESNFYKSLRISFDDMPKITEERAKQVIEQLSEWYKTAQAKANEGS